MPFKAGKNPVMRTKKFYESGKVYLKDRIKIFIVHFNTKSIYDHHKGAREFATWHLPQIQFKNPNVQCLTLRNMTPTPFIRCFLENNEDIIIDIDNREKKDILNHVINVLGKPLNKLKEELQAQEEKENPANFGYLCKNRCICQIIGQVPCPGIVPLPKHVRGKTTRGEIPLRIREGCVTI